jgi:hypothetical protein
MSPACQSASDNLVPQLLFPRAPGGALRLESSFLEFKGLLLFLKLLPKPSNLLLQRFVLSLQCFKILFKVVLACIGAFQFFLGSSKRDAERVRVCVVVRISCLIHARVSSFRLEHM